MSKLKARAFVFILQRFAMWSAFMEHATIRGASANVDGQASLSKILFSSFCFKNKVVLFFCFSNSWIWCRFTARLTVSWFVSCRCALWPSGVWRALWHTRLLQQRIMHLQPRLEWTPLHARYVGFSSLLSLWTKKVDVRRTIFNQFAKRERSTERRSFRFHIEGALVVAVVFSFRLCVWYSCCFHSLQRVVRTSVTTMARVSCSRTGGSAAARTPGRASTAASPWKSSARTPWTRTKVRESCPQLQKIPCWPGHCQK